MISIGLILPDIMGTYGDSGNATILQKRAELRGIPATIIPITVQDAVPESLDMYVIGGAEDLAQQLAVEHLTRYKGLQRAIERKAPVLVVCAAIQICGQWWETSTGQRYSGLGLVDVTTTPMAHRAIGEIIVTPGDEARNRGITEPLTGFENHRGGSILGPAVHPLGKVTHGVGNAYFPHLPHGSQGEGFIAGSVLGTYLHGPLLVRNPQVADMLLACVLGTELEPLELQYQQALRLERLAAGRKRPSNPAKALLPVKV